MADSGQTTFTYLNVNWKNSIPISHTFISKGSVSNMSVLDENTLSETEITMIHDAIWRHSAKIHFCIKA